MTTRRETIMAALATQLSANMPGVTVERGQEEPQAVPSGGWLNLEEGDAERIGELLGGTGPVGEWELTVEAQILVQSTTAANRNSVFDGVLELLGSAIETDRTLGSACDYVEIMEPGGHEIRNIEGAASIRSAVVEIRCYYDTTDNPFEGV